MHLIVQYAICFTTHYSHLNSHDWEFYSRRQDSFTAAGPSKSGRSSDLNSNGNGALRSTGLSNRSSRSKGRGDYRQLADDEDSPGEEVTLFVGGQQPRRNGSAAAVGSAQSSNSSRPGRPGHVTFRNEASAAPGPADGRAFDRMGLDANGNANGSLSVNMDELDPELAQHVQKQQASAYDY